MMPAASAPISQLVAAFPWVTHPCSTTSGSSVPTGHSCIPSRAPDLVLLWVVQPPFPLPAGLAGGGIFAKQHFHLEVRHALFQPPSVLARITGSRDAVAKDGVAASVIGIRPREYLVLLREYLVLDA